MEYLIFRLLSRVKDNFGDYVLIAQHRVPQRKSEGRKCTSSATTPDDSNRLSPKFKVKQEQFADFMMNRSVLVLRTWRPIIGSIPRFVRLSNYL
jgi:hypothetical protein